MAASDVAQERQKWSDVTWRVQVILDKNPTLRTVVNKLSSIDHTYRNFQMEVLAGEGDFNCEVWGLVADVTL